MIGASGAYVSQAVEKSRGTLVQGERVMVVGKLLFIKAFPTGWAVGRITTEDFGDLGVNGNPLAGLPEKGTYEFTGVVERHATYGLQLKVEAVGLHVPDNREGIQKFLRQNFKGVGQKAAEKIVLYYAAQPGGLAEFRKNLLSNPYAMDFSAAGIKRKTSMDSVDGVKGMIYMDLATRIGGLEVGDKLLRKMAAYLEGKIGNASDPAAAAWQALCANPYAPIRELSGYAFRMADSLARKIGFDLSRPERIGALVTHAINEGCNASGHSFLTEQNFRKIIHSIDPSVDVAAALKAAQDMQEPLVMDGERYYLEANYKAEMSLARNLAKRHSRILRHSVSDLDGEALEQAIDAAQSAIGFALDGSQRNSVRGILTSYCPVHTITAGPGCGKTTIMEVVVRILEGKTKVVRNPETEQFETVPYQIGFCAPTGKAAKVLNARIARFGLAALTIHNLLGVRGSSGGEDGESMGMFIHNYSNPLDVDLLIVDETSMVDLALMQALMSAMPEASHIVFLGDPKQLPSVGPGACLADLLQLPLDHHQLNLTHRNQGGILEVVTQAGLGRIDFKPRPDVTFFDGLPEATEESIGSVMDDYGSALAQCGHDFSKVGLLIARKKGDPDTPGWNSTYLNAMLRERYNPEKNVRLFVTGIEGRARAVKGVKIYGTRFRVDDRVIVRKNISITRKNAPDAPAEQVVNGDTGTIADFVVEKGSVTELLIRLDDGRGIRLPSEHIDTLDMAYAMTVHSAQGSEFEEIFIICVNGTPSFVHRGILFTAFSRAKKHLSIIGQSEVIRATLARPAPLRNSFLVERFHKWVSHERKRRTHG
jgi:exodeoxyribonuclease V alpha subunit